ncbi:hypothetical protein CAC42_6445 [Sphaceloma murrayae]|uniref:Xaa-Pro aminopeptidase n=1 Tax=Sphaceloma murrayae TaxID=2082308 RepID=A0A2K1QMG6_9PEZI|nr:hypothetical protein CAC42_6445 [Sphaceloma murrayae]
MASIQLKDASLPPAPNGKYPAKAHARKVAEWIRSHARPKGTNGSTNGSTESSPAGTISGIIYLEGQKTHMVEDDDQTVHFTQRRHFYYLSGCNLPDSHLAYDIERDHLTLFIPPIDADSVIWSGLPELPKDALQKYEIDACQTTDEINAYLSSVASKSTIYTISEQVSKSISFSSFQNVNATTLKKAIDYCRVTKDDFEISLIRHANLISSSAHRNVMRMVKQAKNEEEIMGAFIGTCISNGGREQAYHCICASGTSAATLHYVHNDLTLSKKLNLLIDAGCEYSCYCADITRTYPLNGTFTKESREIYDLVDKMQNECMVMLRGGVRWEEVHTKAHTVAIDGLLKLGILKGDNKEIFDSRVSTCFLPHGLGHYLGMNTHDSGGDANYEDPDPMFRYLRIRGTVPAGAVVTNEPGIYFCRFIIEPALKDPKLGKYIDEKVLESYWNVGGVRIEDDIWIKEDGWENLTTAPRGWEEIEGLINGS